MKGNPVRTMALATLITGAVATFVPAAVIAAVLGVLSIALGVGVHELVTPVTTATTQVVEAATDAATQAVQSLGVTTVGVVGEVTEAGRDVITTTVHDVVGALGG